MPGARAAEFEAVTLRGQKQARASARVFAWDRRASERCLHRVNGGSTPMPKHKIPSQRFIQPTDCSHCHRRGARYSGSRAVNLALPSRSPVPARAPALEVQSRSPFLGPFTPGLGGVVSTQRLGDSCVRLGRCVLPGISTPPAGGLVVAAGFKLAAKREPEESRWGSQVTASIRIRLATVPLR